MEINNKTYCSLAFAGFDNREKSVCCFAKLNKKYNSFTEIQNSQELKTLQNDLLNGVKNKSCAVCWDWEEYGATSMRGNFIFGKSNEDLKNEVQNKKLKHLVIDSGNVCNLSCRMCGPGWSTGWFKESNARGVETFNKEDVVKTDIEALMQEDYSELRSVEILGGEPFMNLEHLKIIKRIIDSGNARRCNLSYTTNGTHRPSPLILDYFKQFYQVVLNLSIDATGKLFSYIRTGGNWEVILSNFKFLRYAQQKYDNLLLTCHPTIGALNVLQLDELWSWFSEQNLIDRYLQTTFVVDPKHYSFSIFNDKQKNDLIKKLNNSNHNLNPVVKAVQDSTFDYQAREQFFKEIDFTEKYKKLNSNEYLQPLVNFLNS